MEGMLRRISQGQKDKYYVMLHGDPKKVSLRETDSRKYQVSLWGRKRDGEKGNDIKGNKFSI